MISKLRKTTKGFANAIGKPLADVGIHPTWISLLAIPLALLSASYTTDTFLLEGFIFALLALSMDLIDGAVARISGKASAFGNYFETMIDKYVELILFLPFIIFYPLATFLAIGFSLIESYAKPRTALVIQLDNHDWPAIGEHGDRMGLLLFGMLFTSISVMFVDFPLLEPMWQFFEWLGMDSMQLTLWLIVLITFIGGIQRILYAKKLIKTAEKEGKLHPYITGNGRTSN